MTVQMTTTMTSSVIISRLMLALVNARFMALSIGGERRALWTPSGKDVRCGRRRINVCQSGSGSVGFSENTALLQLYLEEVPPLGFELGDLVHLQ